MGNIFTSLINFGVIGIKVLQYDMRNLSLIPGEEEFKIKQCIVDHLKLKGSYFAKYSKLFFIMIDFYCRYMKQLNSLFSFLALFEFLDFTLSICMLLIMVVIVSISKIIYRLIKKNHTKY